MRAVCILAAGVVVALAPLCAQSIGGDSCQQLSSAPTAYGGPLPPPLGPAGQPNGTGAGNALNQIGPVSTGTGPIESWAAAGTMTTSRHVGPPGAPVTLMAGPASTGYVTIMGTSLDIDLFSPLAFPIYDGLGLTGPPAPIAFPPSGIINVPYIVPGVTAMLVSLQGFTLDPASPLGIGVTARNDVGAQVVTGIGVPELPPLIQNSGAVQPLPVLNPANKCFGLVNGATTVTYPFPRDAICPNNGPVGTIHSAVGVNFDATLPGATCATVNGIAVAVAHVRPNELSFSLTPAHEPLIGGPLVITSTGGTSSPSPDNMENWVLARPPSVSMLVEPPATGYGSAGNSLPSGTLSFAGGLQGAVGIKDAQGQLDAWDATGIAPGTIMRIFCGQLDPVTGQILSQTSTYYTLVTPPGTAYISTSEPWRQSWYATAPNCLNDTYLHGTTSLIPGNPGSGPLLGPAQAAGWSLWDQDDGGPGTDSFKGNPGLPSAATNQGVDPDAAHMATGDDWIVVDDFGNAPIAGNPSPWPYDYILIAYW